MQDKKPIFVLTAYRSEPSNSQPNHNVSPYSPNSPGCTPGQLEANTGGAATAAAAMIITKQHQRQLQLH